jgi:hypothetical protein
MSLLDDTGGSRTPCGTRRTRPPRAPAGRTGFSGAEQGTRSALPRLEVTEVRPSPASSLPFLTVTPRREREAGIESAKTAAPVREPRSSRDAVEPFGKQPTFSKTEDPSFTRFPGPGCRAGPASVALHGASTRFRSSWFAKCGGLFDRRSTKTDSLLTPRADRFQSDHMNSPAFARSRAPSVAERLRRIENRAPTSANRREGRAHPGAARDPARGRVERACAGHRRPRAAEHRLPGWESSSRSTGRPDPTKLRQ